MIWLYFAKNFKKFLKLKNSGQFNDKKKFEKNKNVKNFEKEKKDTPKRNEERCYECDGKGHRAFECATRQLFLMLP